MDTRFIAGLTFTGYLTLVGVIIVVLVPIFLIIWSKEKKELGTIRCRRCNYVGPAKGLFILFRGITPVCEKCDSEDWVAEQEFLSVWSKQSEDIGTIRCRRCNYVGPAKGLFIPLRGITPVCEKCDSEDWVAEHESPSEFTLSNPREVDAAKGRSDLDEERVRASRQDGLICSVCPKCTSDLEIPVSYIGMNVRCPKCGSLLSIALDGTSIAFNAKQNRGK